MTTASALADAATVGGAGRLLSVAWRAGRSPWVWTPAAVGTAGLATATVALSRILTTPPSALRPRLAPRGLRVTPAETGHVHVVGAGADIPGRWGLEYPGGHGEVGPAKWVDADRSCRPFLLHHGVEPTPVTPSRFTANIWSGLAAFSSATGITGSEVVVEGETGPLPAWILPAGQGTDWALLVHGRGATRAQMLRLVPALHARGVTSMVVSYRNDSPECSDPSGRMHFGHREWRDLEAAADAALARGAARLLLGGMSMGGAIIGTFLRRSQRAEAVVGTILDSPALNWGPVLRQVARSMRLPGWLVPGVMTTAAWRARIDWAALNHVAAAHRLTCPVLLTHGDRDGVVPVELSDAYAESRPDLVTYRRVADAGHVAAWNCDPGGYDAAVGAFLNQLIPQMVHAA